MGRTSLLSLLLCHLEVLFDRRPCVQCAQVSRARSPTFLLEQDRADEDREGEKTKVEKGTWHLE